MRVAIDMRTGRNPQQGFTLLEIMVVVIIIGILAALIAPQIFGQVDKARVVKAKQDIATIESALEMYRLDNFRYPTTDQGLKALVEQPPDVRTWKPGGYLRSLKKDPWDKDYLYANPSAHGKQVDVFTYGADGQEGGEDFDADIGNWDSN